MGADIAFLRASDDEVGKTVWAETLLDEMNATEFSKAVSFISGGPQALALGFGQSCFTNTDCSVCGGYAPLSFRLRGFATG